MTVDIVHREFTTNQSSRTPAESGPIASLMTALFYLFKNEEQLFR